jgi:hypothetical protein
MARIHLDGLGAHALRHETLEVRIDRAIFGRDGVIAGFRSPGCMRGLTSEQSLLERLLDRIQHLGLSLRKVARKITQKSLLGKPSFIAVELDAGRRRRRRIGLGQGRVIFARVRRPSGNINKRGDIRMYAGFGDDHAGEGMADQNRRPVLPCQHALG